MSFSVSSNTTRGALLCPETLHPRASSQQHMGDCIQGKGVYTEPLYVTATISALRPASSRQLNWLEGRQGVGEALPPQGQCGAWGADNHATAGLQPISLQSRAWPLPLGGPAQL